MAQAQQTISVAITAQVAGLVSGMKEAAGAVATGSQQVAQGFGATSQAAHSAATAHTGLLSKLKEFKAEQVTQARTARFYAQELGSIIPAADGARNSLADLIGVGIEGLAGGLSLGLAFEGVKLAVGYFVDLAEAQKKAHDAWQKYAADLTEDTKKFVDGIHEMIAAMNGATRAEQLLGASLGGSQGLLAKQADLDARRTQALALKRRVDSPGAGEGVTDFSVVLARRKEVNEYLADLDRQLEVVHREIQARSEAADELDAKEETDRAEETADEQIASNRRVTLELLEEHNKRRAALREFAAEEMADIRAIERAKSAAIQAVRAEQDRKAEIRVRELARQMEQLTNKQIDQAMHLADAVRNIGAAAGEAFGKMVTGADSVEGALKGVLQSLVMIATAEMIAAQVAAMRTAIEEGGPIFGFIAGIAAISAVGALLGALISQMPTGGSDAAAPRSPYAGATPAFGGAGGGNLVMQVNAVDGASVYRMVSSPAFAGAMREARRNGVL